MHSYPENILVFPIETGSFLCDGGTLFGTTPKTIWSTEIEPDMDNRIRLSMRSLLVVSGCRIVLIETGAGNKYNQDFIEANGLENNNLLKHSIQNAGFSPDEITDVVLTHLHWDHCGGGVCFDGTKHLQLTFPQATYHCSRIQWENAMAPTPVEEESFIRSDLLTLKQSGKLNLIEREGDLFPCLTFHLMNGHTPGMLVPEIKLRGRNLIYLTDLAPMLAFIPLLRISAYDLDPRLSVQEKAQFFAQALQKNSILFFVHDCENECCTLKWDEQGQPVPDQKGRLADFT